MSKQLTTEDARQSLHDHVASKALEIREKYGPHIGWAELQRVLQDRSCVRYPCEIVFDGGPLAPGELAYPAPRGERPEDGFSLHVHPYFAAQPDRLPAIVLYQLVLVNYGEFASADDAEIFGSTTLGLDQEAYYQSLCSASDELTRDD